MSGVTGIYSNGLPRLCKDLTIVGLHREVTGIRGTSVSQDTRTGNIYYELCLHSLRSETAIDWLGLNSDRPTTVRVLAYFRRTDYRFGQ